MKKYIFKNSNGIAFIRIDRKKAKKLFKNGLPVWVCPCNIRPFGPWTFSGDLVPTYYLSEEGYKKEALEKVFNSTCNAYEHYTCNAETGKYLNFYMPICKIDFMGNKIPNNNSLWDTNYYDYNSAYDYDALTETVKADIKKYFGEG